MKKPSPTRPPTPESLLAGSSGRAPCVLTRKLTRKVDVRLPGKGNSNPHSARPVHLIITMMKWIRTNTLSTKISLSLYPEPNPKPARSVSRFVLWVWLRAERDIFIDNLLVVLAGSSGRAPRVQVQEGADCDHRRRDRRRLPRDPRAAPRPPRRGTVYIYIYIYIFIHM